MSPLAALPRPTLAATRTALVGAGLAALVGALAGTAGAGFLVALDTVTAARFAHPWLLALLPLAGVLMVWAYRVAGQDAEGPLRAGQLHLVHLLVDDGLGRRDELQAQVLRNRRHVYF